MRHLSGKFMVILALGLVICLPGIAGADYTMSDTFGYLWTDPGLGNGQDDPNFMYDQINTSITAGSVTFSSALMGTNAATISFTDNTWAGKFIDPTHSTASGPEKGLGQQLIWNYNFSGTNPPGPTYPYTIKIDYFDKGLLLGYELYNITGIKGYKGDFTPVPLPASVLLLGSGLAGLGLVGWRRQNS